MSDQIENIIRYIENEMPVEERIAFEQLIQENEALAKEVTFQRGLHGFLSRNQPELESKLDALGDEFIINKSNEKSKYFLISVILLITLPLGAYFLFFYEKKTPPIEKKEVTDFEEEIETLPTPVEENTINPIEELKEETQPTPFPERPKENDSPPPSTEPIAAVDDVDYSPHPALEGLIADNYRDNGKEDTMKIDAPKMDAILKEKSTTPFKVTGTTNVSPPYDLIIYSNRFFDIENDYRVLNQELTGTENNGAYTINFNAIIPLEKGLYYLIVRKGGSRTMLHVSRFRVE